MSEQCREALDQLYAYLDRELDEGTVEEIRFHLGDCPPCDRQFAFEERLQAVVKVGIRENVPTEVMDRLRVVIRSEGLRSP